MAIKDGSEALRSYKGPFTKDVRPKSRFSDPLPRLSGVVRKLIPPLPRRTSDFLIYYGTRISTNACTCS